jgi:hypothetical protein
MSLTVFQLPRESRYDSVHWTTNEAMNIVKRIPTANTGRDPARRAMTYRALRGTRHPCYERPAESGVDVAAAGAAGRFPLTAPGA